MDQLGQRVSRIEGRMTNAEQDINALQQGHRRMADAIREMADKLDANAVKLDRNNELTEFMATGFDNAKGFFKTIAWMGKSLVFIGKWVVMPFAVAGVLVYMAFHGGHPPPWWPEFLKFFF